MKMTIRKTSKKTPRCWELDLGLVAGKRMRSFYLSREDAEAALDGKQKELRLDGINSLILPAGLRVAWVDHEKEMQQAGTTFRQLMDFWNLHRHKMNPVPLADAINACVEAKRAAGNREVYIKTLQRCLDTIAEDHPKSTTASITTSDVERWARKPRRKSKGSVSLETVRGRLIDARTLFNFCIKRKWLLENPCASIEAVKLEEKPPGIHTIEQVEALLKAAKKHDRALLGYLCPIYFGGLRPSESRTLTAAQVHDGVIEVQGPKGKGRRRRFIPINDTLKAWLALPGIKYGISPRTRRLKRIQKLAKVPWPHDVLRHTFCSYALPQFGASKTAEWAGHSEQILFAHYRERVKPADVASFWSLRP